MIEIVFLILLILIASGLGKKTYGIFKINFSNFLEEFVFSLGLGWIILSYLTLLLRLLGLLSRVYFYGLLLVTAFLAFPQIKAMCLYLRQEVKSLRKPQDTFFVYLILIFLLVHILFGLIGALAPPVDWDGLVYHLTLPKSYLQHIDISYNHTPFFTMFPQNAEMLYLLGMGLKSDILAKLIHFSMGIVLAFSIFSFSRKFLSLKVGLLAAAIFYTMPLIGSFLSTTANIELFIYFFEFLSIYAFFNWWGNSNKSWLCVSGIMIGFAMGAKYLSLASFFLITLGIIIKVLIIDKKSLNFLFKPLIGFVSLAFVLSSYWYIKNIILLGNPFWPFLYRIFGGLSLPPETLKYLDYKLANFGVSRSLVNFLLLPWNLIFAPLKFGGSYLSPLFFVFLPALLFIKEKKKIIIYLLIFCGLYLSIWFWLFSQQLRFLSFVVSLLSICTAYTIERIITLDYKFKKVIYVIIFSWFFVATANIILDHKDEIPVVLGMQSSKSYLAKKLWFYQDIDYLNHNLPEDSNILLVDFDRCYYLERKYTYGDLVNQRHILYKNYDRESLIERLRELGITHILIHKDFYNRKLAIENKENMEFFDEKMKDYDSLVKLLKESETKNKYLELIYSGNFNLYKIKENIL